MVYIVLWFIAIAIVYLLFLLFMLSPVFKNKKIKKELDVCYNRLSEIIEEQKDSNFSNSDERRTIEKKIYDLKAGII